MYSATDFEIIKQIILTELNDIEMMYLFGSYAKGCAQPDSDVDIAIIVHSGKQWWERKTIMNKLYMETAAHNIEVDFVIKDQLTFEREKMQPTLSRTIANEGKLLWKKSE